MLVPLASADERCGPKAANLARLMRAGFDVPPGFVVLDVLGSDGWRHELAAAIRDAPARPVAVRSSAWGEDGAAASFAGQLHTVLDVTDPAQVIAAVHRVAGSGSTARAVAYAARMGREPPAVIPVIVQSLVRAEVAGVMFTGHPVTGSHEVVIEAGPGLGEDVVGGTVTPWTWTVGIDGVAVGVDTPPPPLTQARILELAELGRRIEAVFGCPQDIEWAIADSTAWVLQSRPVTTIPGTTIPSTTIPGTTVPRAGRAEQVAGRVLTWGTPGSPGTAAGPARIVRGLDDFARFDAGDVLVCRHTSPAWTPLLARASAVVTETGGLLAHAAIVAREFGIPAVLAADDAMAVLIDGVPVVVDGTAGLVTAAGHR